jgi:hypothetical protein
MSAPGDVPTRSGERSMMPTISMPPISAPATAMARPNAPNPHRIAFFIRTSPRMKPDRRGASQSRAVYPSIIKSLCFKNAHSISQDLSNSHLIQF